MWATNSLVSFRYKHVIDKLLEQGFSVYSHDHPGHGRTEGQPRTYFNSFDTDIVGLSIKYSFFDQILPYLLSHLGTLIWL